MEVEGGGGKGEDQKVNGVSSGQTDWDCRASVNQYILCGVGFYSELIASLLVQKLTVHAVAWPFHSSLPFSSHPIPSLSLSLSFPFYLPSSLPLPSWHPTQPVTIAETNSTNSIPELHVGMIRYSVTCTVEENHRITVLHWFFHSDATLGLGSQHNHCRN